MLPAISAGWMSQTPSWPHKPSPFPNHFFLLLKALNPESFGCWFSLFFCWLQRFCVIRWWEPTRENNPSTPITEEQPISRGPCHEWQIINTCACVKLHYFTVPSVHDFHFDFTSMNCPTGSKGIERAWPDVGKQRRSEEVKYVSAPLKWYYRIRNKAAGNSSQLRLFSSSSNSESTDWNKPAAMG